MLTVRIFSNDEYLHSMEPRMIAPNALPMLRDVDISNAVSISLLIVWSIIMKMDDKLSFLC